MNERVLNLLSLCIQAKGKGVDAFMNFSPHTMQIDVSVFEKGWARGEKADFKMYFYFGENNELYCAETAERLEAIEAYLKGLI